MKVLLSGLIAAAVTATVWLALEHVTMKDLGWLACLVGLATGIAIHKAAGAHAHESFGRGALAVVLTLAASVGGRMLYVEYMRSVEARLTVEVARSAEAVGAVDEGALVVDVEEGAPERDSNLMTISDRSGDTSLPMSKPSVKRTLSEWDSLWLCLAALAAYVTGKGTDKQTHAAVPKESEEQPPVEPQQS